MARGAIVLGALIGCIWSVTAAQLDVTRFEYEPGTGRLMRKELAVLTGN